ncbi:MAG: methionine biosynthesis protein MetW [Gammaproteobacteria bacterium]|nr:methionine biosynthesis protein MetW [Gammaproteobacteria bacterium]
MNLRTDLQIISDWIKPSTSVLDLGCGKGELLYYLQQQHQVTGYGLEIAEENITSCIQSGVNVIQLDLDGGLADFKDNSFDYVVMAHTLQAVRHPEQLLQEMLRIGKEGIVTFPNFGHWRGRLHLFLHGSMPVTRALPNSWYNTPNIHLCTIRDFEKLCHEQGIHILQRSVVNHAHRHSLGARILPNLLGEIAIYHFCKK